MQRRNGERSTVDSSSSPLDPKLKHGIIAGLVVVIGGAIAAWVMMEVRGLDDEDGEDSKPSLIAEVKPQIATNAVEETPKAKRYKDLTRDEKLKYYQDKYDDSLPENFKPIVYYLKNPPQRKLYASKTPQSHLQAQQRANNRGVPDDRARYMGDEARRV